jgi:hypothetical protein
MTSASKIDHQDSRERGTPDADRSLRFRLKPEGPATGSVDGAWWPYSHDLPAELPALVRALSGDGGAGARMSRVERVSYNLGTWGPTARVLDVDGVVVRLGGFRSQHANTVDLICRNERLTLLVVPPDTAGEAADLALVTAAEAGNTGSIENLLHSAPSSPTGPAITA